MKKLLTIFLSIILSISSLTLISCKKDDNYNELLNKIEEQQSIIKDLQAQIQDMQYTINTGIRFTATAPAYFYADKFNNLQSIYFATNSDTSGDISYYQLDPYDVFVEEYQNNLKQRLDKGFYIMDAGNDEYIFYPNLFYRSYQLLAKEDVNGKLVEPLIYISYQLEDIPLTENTTIKPLLPNGQSRPGDYPKSATFTFVSPIILVPIKMINNEPTHVISFIIDSLI